MMTQTVEALVLDLLEWLASKDRSYEETMDWWRTSCPRLFCTGKPINVVNPAVLDSAPRQVRA